MIRVTAVGQGSEHYYLDQVELGVEAPGRWAGTAAADLGLDGRVSDRELVSVLGVSHPRTGEPLRPRPSANRAYDLTISLPKSVSVLWAVGDEGTTSAIEAARDAAVTATVGYLEAHAVQPGRRPEPGHPAQPGHGMVAAAFAHRTSRAGDPYLHTHLLVVNLARDGRGRWGALDALALVAQARTAGRLFEAQLRHEVSLRLEVRWGPVVNGVAQLEGVPAPVRREFSQRRRQVEEGMARYHGSSPESARLAALVGRPDKDPERSASRLAGEWRRRAGALGFDPASVLAGPAGGPGRSAPGTPVLDGLDAAALGLDRLSSFSRSEVLEAMCDALPGGATIADIEARSEGLLASTEVRSLPGLAPPRRRDMARVPHATVPVPTDRERWTTDTAAEAEERVSRVASRQSGTGRGVVEVTPGRVHADPEVDRTVTSLLTAGNGVDLVRTGPGPARDAVLAGSVGGWTEAGYRVLLSSPDEAQRRELEIATGLPVVPTSRLAEDLGLLARPGPQPTVLVVSGTESLAPELLAGLAESAERTQAKLVLLGNPGPYPEQDRAGGWRAAEAAVGSHHLSRPAHARPAAIEQVAAPTPTPPGGRPPPHDRAVGPEPPPPTRFGPSLVMAAGPESLREAMVADWSAAGRGAVMVARRRPDIDDLNRRARSALVEQGVLHGEPTPFATSIPLHPGDRVVVGKAGPAARRAGFAPGQSWSVTASGLEPRPDTPGPRPVVPPSGLEPRPGGPPRSVPGDGLPADLDLRYAYALTPYQAWRSGAERQLVLGGPGPDGSRDGCVYYSVAAGRDVAARAAELDPPRYLVAALGRPPEAAGRREWRAAAGEIEAYRGRWGITDPDRALGGPATDPSQRVQLEAAARTVEASARRTGWEPPAQQLGRPGPDREPPGRSLVREREAPSLGPGR